MTPQREEASRLLRLAWRDKETFDLPVPLPQASLAALGFHAQQAAEKSLKAVAVLAALDVPRTHDLVALAQLVLDGGLPLPVDIEQLRVLNPFAVEYRYDDELIPATTREALAGILEEVLRWAESTVSH